MNVVTPELNTYMHELLPERHAVLKELETYATERRFPIVGPLVGNFFAQLASLIGARRIMELGSGFGYSALWFASVLPPDGEIICTDGDDANRVRAEDAFARVGVADRIHFHTGDALTVFAGIEGDFDIIISRCLLGAGFYSLPELVLEAFRNHGNVGFTGTFGFFCATGE